MRIALKGVSPQGKHVIHKDAMKLMPQAIPSQVQQVAIPEFPNTSGMHTWLDASGRQHKYHWQCNLVNLGKPPLVLFWLPGCGKPHDPQWNALAKLLGRTGRMADMVHNDCILVLTLDDSRVSKSNSVWSCLSGSQIYSWQYCSTPKEMLHLPGSAVAPSGLASLSSEQSPVVANEPCFWHRIADSVGLQLSTKNMLIS